MPEFRINMDFIPVPAEFVEKHMTEANGAYVKVYLYAMNLARKGVSENTAEIAKNLKLLESDVVNALEYWGAAGMLYADGKTEAPEKSAAPKKTQKTAAEITSIMTENKTLADLCTIAQEILGKTLNTKDLETLYWFYDELGLSPEVISMLLEYCVSKGKRSMNYIEKVAITWHENGITTIGAAENYTSEEREKSSYFYSLRKLFGIADRNLSKSEETYLKVWRDDYGMSEDMVALAYEYCVLQTTKLSFPYMNSIIKRWYENGVTTVQEAEADRESFKAGSRKNPEQEFDIYKTDVDHDELAKIIQEKLQK